MLGLLRSVSYLAIVKWKAGERRALESLWPSRRRSMIPLFEMPPAGDFDHEEQRVLSPTEHIKSFGRRLHDSWGHSLAFIDAKAVDNDIHKADLSAHPLTELLERARLAKALACPATSLKHSPEYQNAVQRFVSRDSHLPIAIRVNPLDDMESETFSEDLQRLLDQLGCAPERVALVLDFASLGALKPAEVEGFVETVIERIFDAIALGPWLKVITAFTSFPAELKMKANTVETFPRTDWIAYRLLLERQPSLRSVIAFGDYAIDCAPFAKSSGPISPSAQLRLTSGDDYLVVKGEQAKQPIGYGAIRPVADILSRRDEFAGPTICDGDAWVARLARDPKAGTGNASTWRWAGTDHHFAQVLNDLAALTGVEPVLEEASLPGGGQGDLF